MQAICRVFDFDRFEPFPEERCQVWAVPLSASEETYRAAFESLSIEEQHRAMRYAMTTTRRQFVVSRASLRLLLARNLGVEPQAVTIIPSPSGKPIVHGSGVHFNVTHSGDLGLIALARQRVGIDIEVLREVTNAEGMVQRFFTQEECEQFQKLPMELRKEGFLRGWTCKEALLKAIGASLHDVQCCWLDLDPRHAPRVHRFTHIANDGVDWQLQTWEPMQGYIAALAVESPSTIEIIIGSSPGLPRS